MDSDDGKHDQESSLLTVLRMHLHGMMACLRKDAIDGRNKCKPREEESEREISYGTSIRSSRDPSINPRILTIQQLTRNKLTAKPSHRTPTPNRLHNNNSSSQYSFLSAEMAFGWGTKRWQIHNLAHCVHTNQNPDDSERSYQESREYNGEPHHKAKFGHEALAGAASFGAFKLFEDRQRREGKPGPERSSVPPEHWISSRAIKVHETTVKVNADTNLTGKPVSHAFAKELLVGIAGAEVDKLIESKGLDYIDRKKAHQHARDNVENMYDQHYVNGQGAEQYDPSVHFVILRELC